MNAWFDPTEDGRWPVPHISEQPDDLRETVRMAAQTERLMADIREAFQASEEMKTLRATFVPEVPITMRIESSRKYTRFHLANTPLLRKRILDILSNHGLIASNHHHSYRNEHTVTLTVIRIGAIN